jgi:V8-like Glu-specific endopeptidase
MAHRKRIFTSIPVLILAACAADLPEGSHDVGAARSPVVCGDEEWQHVDMYDGTRGPDKTSLEFVRRHEKPVGIVRFNATFLDNYTTPPANPGTRQPGDSDCTGTLISQNLFLTAGHCFDDDPRNPTDATGTQLTGLETAVSDMEVAFDFHANPDWTTRPGVPFDITAVHEYRLGDIDYAIIELAGNPGDTFGWTRVAAVTPQPGDELTLFQHPFGIPKVVDSGTVMQTSLNGRIAYDDIDTDGGSSGSGILDWQGRLIGVHTHAPVGEECEPGDGNRGWLVEAILPHSPILGSLVREVGDHSEVLASADFNGDSFNDLVVGVPTRHVNGAEGAGAVRILYGSASGPNLATEQWIDQETAGVEGISEGGDFFGAAVTWGYFNSDAYADLAVGAPGEDSWPTSTQDAGAVWVFYGSATGLSGTGSKYLDQEDANVIGESEHNDRMGSALAAGDFNKDGWSDLAVGSPGESVGSAAASGVVTVFYGSAAGVTSTGNQLFDQTAVLGGSFESEAGDRFGASLASGDFDKDGYKDLAIGHPYEDLGAVIDTGAVSILYGSLTKLVKRTGNRFTQGGSAVPGGVEGMVERGDRFGLSLAAGDVSGEGYADLIIGAPGEDIGTQMHAGYIHAVYGTSTGLKVTGNVGLSQDSSSVPGQALSEDRMGMSVSVGQLNSVATVRAEDVLVGVPGERVGAAYDAGTVIELFGRTGALNGMNSVAFTQDTLNVLDACEKGDRFGAVVLARDLNRDGFADALISTIGEDVHTPPAVPVAVPQSAQLLFGSTTGLTATHNKFLP